MEFFLQIVLILACLFYGARKGGVALGLLGGIGVVVLVFAFRLAPGKPPVDVILTIVAVVAFLGAAESLRPLVGGKPLSMVLTIQMFMLMAGAFIIIFTKTNPVSIARNEVFRAGMITVVAVFGVAWMADTVFEARRTAGQRHHYSAPLAYGSGHYLLCVSAPTRPPRSAQDRFMARVALGMKPLYAALPGGRLILEALLLVKKVNR